MHKRRCVYAPFTRQWSLRNRIAQWTSKHGVSWVSFCGDGAADSDSPPSKWPDEHVSTVPSSRAFESGSIRSPDPRKLARLADVLSVPIADLYGLVGYATPSQLPSFYPYLRARYGELPPDAVRKVDRYFKSVQREYGVGTDDTEDVHAA